MHPNYNICKGPTHSYSGISRPNPSASFCITNWMKNSEKWGKSKKNSLQTLYKWFTNHQFFWCIYNQYLRFSCPDTKKLNEKHTVPEEISWFKHQTLILYCLGKISVKKFLIWQSITKDTIFWCSEKLVLCLWDVCHGPNLRMLHWPF